MSTGQPSVSGSAGKLAQWRGALKGGGHSPTSKKKGSSSKNRGFVRGAYLLYLQWFAAGPPEYVDLSLAKTGLRTSGVDRQVSERTEHEQGMCSFVRIRCCVRLFVCQFRACSLVCSVRSHIFRFRNEVHCLALIYLVLPDISDSVSLVVLARTSS